MTLFDPATNNAQIQEEAEIFYDTILENLQTHLVDKNGLTGLSDGAAEKLSALVASGPTVGKSSNSKQQFFISGDKSCSSVDLLMYSHIANTLQVLSLLNTQEKPVNLESAIASKYPAVAVWMETLQAMSQVQKYQAVFESQYVKAME